MKISIVTPSFNQAEFVEHTLQSVLSQDYREVEYIVVDGDSQDGTRETLEKYRSRLNWLIIEPDRGQADAIAKGFRLATGEILCFLNSDDLLMPGTMQFVADYFHSNSQIDAIYSNRIDIDEHDNITGFWILPPHSDYCMSRWDFVPQETCFWRRSLMEKSGTINADFSFALDYDLFVRMMRHGNFKRVNRFLAAFRRHPQSKSTTAYETVGRQEVAQVQQMNHVRIHWYDHGLKYLFGGWILGTSFIFKLLAIRWIRQRARFPSRN